MRDRYERGKGGAANSSYGTMVRDVLYGALVAAVCTALSFILALAGFGRLYYVAVFLPFFMLACLLVAWFLYLKDDGFIRSPRTSGAAASAPGQDGSRLGSSTGLATDAPATESPVNNGPADNGPAGGYPDLSLYAPRGYELVPRRSEDLYGHQSAFGASRAGEGEPGGKRSGGSNGTNCARRALLWAAVQLGLLAVALYSWAGVGAGYFIPVTR